VMSIDYIALKGALRAILQTLPTGQDIFIRAQNHFNAGHVTATQAVKFIIANLPRVIKFGQNSFCELLAKGGEEECYEFMQLDSVVFAN
jgi:hypothetical protein